MFIHCRSHYKLLSSTPKSSSSARQVIHQMPPQSQPQETVPADIFSMPPPMEPQSCGVSGDLDPFQDSMEITFVTSSYTIDNQADWAVGRSVLFAPHSSVEAPSAPIPSEKLASAPQPCSQKEAGRYLREARIALFAHLHYTHPLSWRTNLDGNLVEDESESLATARSQKNGHLQSNGLP